MTGVAGGDGRLSGGPAHYKHWRSATGAEGKTRWRTLWNVCVPDRAHACARVCVYVCVRVYVSTSERRYCRFIDGRCQGLTTAAATSPLSEWLRVFDSEFGQSRTKAQGFFRLFIIIKRVIVNRCAVVLVGFRRDVTRFSAHPVTTAAIFLLPPLCSSFIIIILFPSSQ